MKVQQAKREFHPIAIILDNETEAKAFFDFIDSIDKLRHEKKIDLNLTDEEHRIISGLSNARTDGTIVI